MANYYVDATLGDDSNPGTITQPWKTVSKVNSTSFNAGDKIYFKKGETWRETLTIPSSGSDGSLITFGAYGSSDKPIISAGELAEDWTDMPNESNDEYSIYVGNPPEDADGFVRILIKDGEILEKVPSSQRYDLTNDQWAFYQGRIYYKPPVGHHPSEYKIEYGWRNAALRIENKSWINVENLRFESSNAYDDNAMPPSLVHIENSEYVNLDRCESFYSQLRGMLFRASSNSNITNSEVAWARAHGIACDKKSSHIRISRCKVHDIGNLPWDDTSWVDREGIAIGGAYGNSYITVEWCEVYNVGNNIANCTNCGLFFYGCDHGIARYNKIHDNAKAGIMIADGGTEEYNLGYDTEIYYNLIYNNGWKSQSDDGHFGGLIANIYNQQALDNLKIYNNTIVGNSQNSTDDAKNGGLVIRQPYDATNDAPAYIKNNIIANNEGYQLRVSIAGSLPNLVLDYNCYYRSSGTVIKWNDDIYTASQFSTYQSEKGQDANSKCLDPSFVDPDNGDFRLKADSPCIDAGVDVGLDRDFNYNPVPWGAGVDIGAFELVRRITMLLLSHSPLDCRSDKWVDLSRKGNHGTPYGGARPYMIAPGVMGYRFTWATDYIDCGQKKDLYPQEITIGVWVCAYRLEDWNGIITNKSDYKHGINLSISTSHNISALVGDSDGCTYVETSWFPLIHKWYYIVVIHKENTNKLYVNGVFEDIKTRGLAYNSTPKTIIGRFYYNTLSEMYFQGIIASPCIHNYALSQDEIRENMYRSPIYRMLRGFPHSWIYTKVPWKQTQGGIYAP